MSYMVSPTLVLDPEGPTHATSSGYQGASESNMLRSCNPADVR